MKQDANELAAVEVAVLEGEIQLANLADFQLALVGGGVGEVVFS